MYLNDIDNKIESIIDNFNFSRVSAVMHALHWKWEPENQVPTLRQMRPFVRTLLYNCVNTMITDPSVGNFYYVSSGGFKVTMHKFTDGTYDIELEFIVAECCR